MSFNLMKMLGLQAKRPDMGPIVDATMPYKSITDIGVGSALNDTILSALKGGKGIGFDPSFVDKTTSPVIASKNYRFQKEVLPSLSGDLASRGMSRSSIAGQSIKDAQTENQLGIDEIISNAYLQNEVQKKSDQARYEQEAAQLASQDAAIRGNYSAADTAKGQVLVGANQAQNLQNQDSLNKLISTALAIGTAPVTGGASLASLPSIWTGGTVDTGAWADALTRANKTKVDTETASPFTKKYNPPTMNQMRRYALAN